MEAVVTIKTTPAEFDLIRKALTNFRQEKLADGDNTDNHPEDRRNAKQAALQTDDLLRKLR